ncbi:MAG: metalloregulator ArsR/SmtB family transcription factor [Candidatus Micrarchaeota archaeon]
MRDITLLRALADGTRLKIVKILIKGEKCACKLPTLVNRAQPTVSLQLKYLVAAGVLKSRRDGKMRIYRIANPKVKELLEVF